jgi:hypothetical protein
MCVPFVELVLWFVSFSRGRQTAFPPRERLLLAHLLPLYFIYHRLPLPNSVFVIYCIVQLIARSSLWLGQDATCDKFYNRLPHSLFSINTALVVAKPPVFPPDPDRFPRSQAWRAALTRYADIPPLVSNRQTASDFPRPRSHEHAPSVTSDAGKPSLLPFPSGGV